MTAAYDYDLFVIGAGSGGVRAARLAASEHGQKVAIAEEYRVGGTCVIRGCVPKKFLVYASEFGKYFDHARGYGWSSEKPDFSWQKLIEAKDAEINRLSAIYWRNLENSGVEIIEDRAVFEDAHTLRLVKSNRTLTARTILIATGGRPNRPEELQGHELGFTSDEAFHLKGLPARLIIAGGGYIAVEFAHIFAGLGVKTCLVYRGPEVLRGFDQDVRIAVHEGMKRAGIHVVTNAVLSKLEKTDDHIRAELSDGTSLDTDAVMFAIGRSAHTKGLGLDNAGVEISPLGGVVVDALSRTNVHHIYAVGDVTNRLELTPVAIREAIAFVKTAFGGEDTAYDHTNVPTAVFTQPPVGTVGLTEAEARKAFGKIDVYKTAFRPMKHMLTGDETRVIMKLIVRADTQVVVGCHMVGDDAPEIIQLAGIAVKAGLTKAAWDSTCAVHPSVAEEFVTMKTPYTPEELK
jgi:glutathione reductase (NADPH)